MTGRRRAVLQLTGVLCLVGIYLAWWLSYTALHLPQGEYRQLAPGQTVRDGGADFRLDSIRQTELLNDSYGRPQASPSGTAWVVAILTVTKQEPTDDLYCALTLVGPDGRTWSEETLGLPSRDGDSCPPDDTPLERPVSIEAVFVVPLAYVGQLGGVTLPQNTADPDPVLVPSL